MSKVLQTDPTITRPSLKDCSDAELLDGWPHDQYGDALAVLVQRDGELVLTVGRQKWTTPSDANQTTSFGGVVNTCAALIHPSEMDGSRNGFMMAA